MKVNGLQSCALNEGVITARCTEYNPDGMVDEKKKNTKKEKHSAHDSRTTYIDL